VNDLANTVAEPAAREGIPLDLAPLLTPYRQHKRLTVRVVYLPARAELTRGAKNEDASWSLTPADLDGLALLLPDDVDRPPSIAIRIVVIDKNENASIVGQFEVPLPRRERRMKTSSEAEDSGTLAADWRRRMDRRVAAALRLGQRKTAQALAAAETQWQTASEARHSAQAETLERTWQQKLADERSARESSEAKAAEAARRLTVLTGELEAAGTRLATVEAELARELETRMAAARAGWEAECEQASGARLAAAVAEAERNAEVASHARLQEAQAEWRRAAEREIAAAKREAAEAQAAAQHLEASLAAAEAQRRMESEACPSDQEQVIELAWRQKLEDAHSARDAAQAKAEEAARRADTLSKELEAARLRLSAAEAQPPAKDVETSVAREIERHLAKARSEWRRQSDAERDEAVQQAERRAEVVAEARLRREREDWQHQAQEALAVAEGKWKAEAARRLATAQAEWSRSSEAKAAAGRGTLRRTAKRQGRKQLWRRTAQVGVVAGCAAALFFLYVEFEPLIRQWTPKLIAQASDLGGKAWAELQSLAADVLARL